MSTGVRKLWGTAKTRTAGFIKEAIRKCLGVDVEASRKCKTRRDKKTEEKQKIWWFKILGDEEVLKKLDLNWEEVSAKHGWRLEACLTAVSTVSL